jgi:hypothetical protein
LGEDVYRQIGLFILLWLTSSSALFADEYKFPFYQFEKLVQVDKENCLLNISNQRVIAQKHYEANVKLMAMQWLGEAPALDDPFNFWKSMPGLSLQNSMRYRDMYVHEQMMHQILDREFKALKKMGNAAGNNYNRLQAKNSQVVVEKLSVSRSYLLEMERTLLKILGLQSVHSKRGAKEEGLYNKNEYDKSFAPGLYTATYAPPEYEAKHNSNCMWSPDRMIKKDDPYCGYVWSHGGNFYLERCSGDIHPFGMGHATSAGVKTVREIFNFTSVQKCKVQPSCGTGCFNTCIKKDEFNPRRVSELEDGKCNELVDPLFPKKMTQKTLTGQFLKDSKGFSVWYPKFEVNERDIKDVAAEIERFYLMTGQYEKEDCKKGKRQYLLEVLDAIKQLISLEMNLKEYYGTSSACHIRIAEEVEEKTIEGIKHNVLDDHKIKTPKYGDLMAITKNGGKNKTSFSEQELKEMQSSFFGMTYSEEKKMLKGLIKNDYKFTNDHMGLICERSKKKSFCGGK